MSEPNYFSDEKNLQYVIKITYLFALIGTFANIMFNLINQNAIKVIKFENFKKLSHNLSKELSNGKIVGFFNHRMEWGPRALGNRSILADPRNDNMRDILNVKIKRREKKCLIVHLMMM